MGLLENALSGWNSKLAEIWTLLTQTPETFKGGDIWHVITGVNNALVGIGYGLLVLFFAIGIFQSAAASFRAPPVSGTSSARNLPCAILSALSSQRWPWGAAWS